MEIEKKFLLRRVPDLEEYPVKHIEQGYLCTDPVVRIRKSNDRYILTYKAPRTDEQSDGGDVRVNREVEVPLNRRGYEHLREKVDGHLIQKSRYIIPLEDGHTAELDVFHGVLQGLIFVEVEFASVLEADGFVPPEWFGDNVSSDYRYSNSFLSTCGDLSAFSVARC
jgi:CYTH domain-containing protein